MDMLIGVFMFVSARRMAMLGVNSLVVSATMIAWAFCYGVTSFVLSRKLTRKAAPAIMWLSLILCSICLLGLAFTSAIGLQFVLLLGMGVGTGLFFAPFQTMAVIFSQGGGVPTASEIAATTAKYTFSWSFGIAMGPFLSAFIWGLGDEAKGWQYCYFAAFAFSLLVLVLNVMLQMYAKQRYREMGITSEDHVQTATALAEDRPLTGHKDIIVTAWLFQGIGYIAIAMMRTHIPDFATKTLQMSTFHQGIVMSAVSFAQAAMALACIRAHKWAHRPFIPVTISLLAACSFIFFAYSTDWRIYLICAIVLGAFSGTFCTLATYHGMINPGKSAMYLSVNETLVGVGSILAPLIGGALATCGLIRLPFAVCLAACVACAIIYYCGTRNAKHKE